MNAIEIIATIFGVWVLLKLILLWTMPKQLANWGLDQWIKNSPKWKTFALLATLLVGYFVLRDIDIVVVAAVMLFTAFLYKFTLMSYSEEMKAFAKEMKKKPKAIASKAWLAIVIWAAIAAWTLWALFA